MSELVTIKPAIGSRKFKAVQGMHNKHVVSDASGNTEEKTTGDFNGERFPKSRQMFRPLWSNSRKRWLLHGYEENSEELNEIVKRCKIKYPAKHPRVGQIIDSADIWDFSDPFLSSRYLKVMANEGEIMLDKSKALDKIILLSLLENPQFQSSNEGNPLLSSRVKYLITDRDTAQVAKKDKREKEIRIVKFLEGLTSQKKMKIAIAMGLIPNDNVDIDVVEDLVYTAAKDQITKVSTEGNITRQDMFIKLCEMTNEQLGLKFRIAEAKAKGFLKKNADGFLLFGNPVGKTEKQIEAYISNPDNQELLDRLTKALNDKGN